MIKEPSAESPTLNINRHWSPVKQSAWRALQDLADQQAPTISIAEQLQNPKHRKQFNFEIASLSEGEESANPVLFADLSKHLIDDQIWHALLTLAETSHLKEKIASLFRGDPINFTEKRAAHHTLLRDIILPDVQQRHPDIQATYDRMSTLASECQQQGYRQVIHIGIGGSDLGPRLAVEALNTLTPSDHPSSSQTATLIPAQFHFVANIDPVELYQVLQLCQPEQTLVVVCSKSFGTLETLENAKTVFRWLGNERIGKQVIAVTNNVECAVQFGITENNILPMWDWVGGRYSLWSTIGFTLMLAIGAEGFQRFRQGALAVDRHFSTAPFEQNLPVALALMGIWYHNFLGAQSHGIIPYDHLLARLPSYIQQLDMESNGKSTDQWNRAIHYFTGPIIWGNSGCNSQHSFHQLLHQGNHLVPIDFLLPLKSSIPSEQFNEHYNNAHQLLIANCLAQSDAMVYGQSLQQVTDSLMTAGCSQEEAARLAPHKVIPGNRPHSIIGYTHTHPETLGALLALYEHKTFVQGIIWSINSFDQWGVELGKQLAKPIHQRLSQSNESQQDKKESRLSPSTTDFIERYLKF